MKTISINAYQFQELNPAAKERARQWFRDLNNADDWWRCTYEEIQDQGENLGFRFDKHHAGPAIYFTGFCSQGDGASFAGGWHAQSCVEGAPSVCKGWGNGPDKEEIKRIGARLLAIARKYPAASMTIMPGRRGHSLAFDHHLPDELDTDASAEELASCQAACDELEELTRDFTAWMYSRLASEYEFLNSDAYVDETIEVQEYYFTADGELAPIN